MAELTLGLMLATARNLLPADASMRRARDVKYDEDDYVKGGTVRVGTELYAAEPTSAGDKAAKLLGCYVPWISCLLADRRGVLAVACVVFWLALIGAMSSLVGIVGVLTAQDDDA